MKKILASLALALTLSSCEAQTEFSEKTLSTELISKENTKITFEKILEQYKGKTVFIDVWASWCSDCVKSMPDVNTIKANNPDVVFLNLSVDKTYDLWLNGIDRFKVSGEHYLITDGMKGVFGNSIGLNWIPRFMIVDANGKVALYKATEATDAKIVAVLKELKSK
jgi:thiol-disulfide isomerase/thioredoxin